METVVREKNISTPGHIFVATADGLVDLVGTDYPTVVGKPVFGLGSHGATLILALGSQLEFDVYENGTLKKIAKTGDLGNPTGVAIDDSGLYWVRNSAIERSDGVPTPKARRSPAGSTAGRGPVYPGLQAFGDLNGVQRRALP